MLKRKLIFIKLKYAFFARCCGGGFHCIRSVAILLCPVRHTCDDRFNNHRT